MSTDSKYYEYNPEKRNVFIEIHNSRNNAGINLFMGVFSYFFSHTSAIVEVFLRKRFGERYITLSQAIGLFIIMNLAYEFIEILSMYIFRQSLPDSGRIFLFAFSCVYLGLSIKHRLEIKKYGTAYDFKRFSLSDGERASFWYRIIGKKFIGIRVTPYLVNVFLEPAIPVIVGLFLSLFRFSIAVGVLLIFCGFTFGLRNFGKAQKGRNWMLDNIDKKLASEMKYDVFIGRKPKSETKGVYLPIELPEDEETRQALYRAVEGAFTSDTDIWENDNLDKTTFDSGGMGNG